jgi:hypothetical protein
MVTIKVGRGGTAALTNGVAILLRPIINNGTATTGGREAAGIALQSGTTAADLSTTVNVTVNSGQKEVKTASITGFAVGDWLCIQDSGGGVTRLEFGRIAKLSVASGTGVTLDRNLAYQHTSAQADTVRNKSDVFVEQWLYGGALWEVVFDYADDAAGDSVTVVARARTLDCITQTVV